MGWCFADRECGLPSRGRHRVHPWTWVAAVGFLWITVGFCGTTIQLELKNGDRLSGELVSENDERIVLKSPILGRIKVSRSQIVKKEIVGAAGAGTTNPPVAAAPPIRASGPVPSSAPLFTNAPAPAWFHFAALRPFMTNWHGNVQFGADLGWGTSDRETFYGNVTTSHSYQRLRNLLEYHMTYGFADNVLSANQMNGGWKLDVDIGTTRRLYTYNQFAMGYDTVRHINRQLNEGIGLGYKVLQGPKLVFNTETGAAYQYFDYDNAPARNIMSLRVGENLAWSLGEKLKLTHRFSLMPSVQDIGDFRWHFDVGLSYPFLKRFTLNLNVVDDYDSRPAPNVEPNNLQVQSTFGILF
jgi:hypothetical protein